MANSNPNPHREVSKPVTDSNQDPGGKDGKIGAAFAAILAQSNKLLESSLSNLEIEIEEKLLNIIGVDMLDEPDWSQDESVEDPREYEDEELFLELENYDLLDSPDIEINIEMGDVEQAELFGVKGPAENFLDYTWRRFRTDFDGEDEKTRQIVMGYLEQWQRYPYSFTIESLDFRKEHLDLLPWFEDLLAEADTSVDDAITSNFKTILPDIIFSVSDNKITYDINMGILDKLLISPDSDEIAELSDYRQSVGVPLRKLNDLIIRRRAGLSLLAEYYRDMQRDFILAPSFFDSIDNIQLHQQQDFIQYLEDRGVSKHKTTISRIVKEKNIKIPACSMPLPANICFDPEAETTKALIVLKTLFTLHIDHHQGNPLNGSDQAQIISAVLGVDYTNDQVTRNLWGPLRKKIPSELHKKYRIKGKGKSGIENNDMLRSLIDAIKEEVGINVKGTFPGLPGDP